MTEHRRVPYGCVKKTQGSKDMSLKAFYPAHHSPIYLVFEIISRVLLAAIWSVIFAISILLVTMNDSIVEIPGILVFILLSFGVAAGYHIISLHR